MILFHVITINTFYFILKSFRSGKLLVTNHTIAIEGSLA